MDDTTCSCRRPQGPMYASVAPRTPVKLQDWQRQGPRCRCARCGGIVSATTGTASAGRRTDLHTSLRGATALAEGVRIRATGRLLDGDKETAKHWRPVLGQPCQSVMHSFFRTRHLHECPLEEWWTCLRKQEDHLTSWEKLAEVAGEAWGWLAFSPGCKWVPAWVGGKRTLRPARRRLCRLTSATDEPIPFFTRDALPHYADAWSRTSGLRVMFRELSRADGEGSISRSSALGTRFQALSSY
jgi:hypothetical protein